VPIDEVTRMRAARAGRTGRHRRQTPAGRPSRSGRSIRACSSWCTAWGGMGTMSDGLENSARKAANCPSIGDNYRFLGEREAPPRGCRRPRAAAGIHARGTGR